MSAPRGAYVATVRAGRRLADQTGVLDRLARSEHSTMRHLRTLFAIHDVVDLAALDLPWWSYPAIRRVDAFLAGRPRARVFEFGAGASTAWIARRAAEVHSVEHDESFAEHVRSVLDDPANQLDNVALRTIPPGTATGATAIRSGRRGYQDADFTRYVSTIDRIGGEFDLIVVDGRARVDSFRRALHYLADDGLVVFDNIRRTRYRPAIQQSGIRCELLRGATPALPYPTTTGLITRG